MVENLDAEQQRVIAEGRIASLKVAEAEFNKLDANNDGTVEKAELIAFAKSQTPKGFKEPTPEQRAAAEAQMDQMIAQFDQDQDGKVSKEEWLGLFGNIYD